MKLQPILKTYLSGNDITIWTICDLKAWEAFQQTGIIRGDGRRICYPSFRRAYHWMIKQMVEKIPGHRPGQYPVWAWYYPRPDLRHTGHLPKNSQGMLLKCQVPTSRVLLSEFCAWHHVLNQWYLPLTKEEDNVADEEERIWRKKHWIGPKYWEARLARATPSWQRIFDLRAINKSKLIGPVDRIQATISYIKLDEVVKVTPFTAR